MIFRRRLYARRAMQLYSTDNLRDLYQAKQPAISGPIYLPDGPVTREELRAEIQRRLWWDRWGNRLLLVGRVCGSDRGRRGQVSARAGVGLARYDGHGCRRSYHSTPVIPLVSRNGRSKLTPGRHPAISRDACSPS